MGLLYNKNKLSKPQVGFKIIMLLRHALFLMVFCKILYKCYQNTSYALFQSHAYNYCKWLFSFFSTFCLITAYVSKIVLKYFSNFGKNFMPFQKKMLQDRRTCSNYMKKIHQEFCKRDKCLDGHLCYCQLLLNGGSQETLMNK